LSTLAGVYNQCEFL
jgi:hypothetical protein